MTTPIASQNNAGAGQHPLDPLTVEEIVETTRILNASGRITSRVRIMAYRSAAMG